MCLMLYFMKSCYSCKGRGLGALWGGDAPANVQTYERLIDLDNDSTDARAELLRCSSSIETVAALGANKASLTDRAAPGSMAATFPPAWGQSAALTTLTRDAWAAIARCALTADGYSVQAWCRLSLVSRTFRNAVAGDVLLSAAVQGHCVLHLSCLVALSTICLQILVSPRSSV